MKHLHSFLTILCISLLVSTLLISGCKQDVYTPRPQSPEEQASQIRADLSLGMHGFAIQITVTPYSDDAGNLYFVGTIDPELDSMLNSVVDAYNTEAHPQEPLDVNFVRYGLTDNVKDTADQMSHHKGALFDFFTWVTSPADLVYKGEVLDGDGVVHEAGDPVPGNTTNYDYIQNKDGKYRNYTYADQYTGPTQ